MTITIPPYVRAQALPAALELATALSPFLRRSPKARRVLAAISMGRSLHTAVGKARARLQPPAETWTVKVSAAGDDLFDIALNLIGSQSEQNWREVEAELRVDYDLDDNRTAGVRTSPTQSVERVLVLDGHRIYATLNAFPAFTGVRQPGEMGRPVPVVRDPEITFSASSEAGQAAVIAALAARAEKNRSSTTVRKPRLYTSRNYGGWKRRGELPARPVESVAVTDGQVQRIVTDIDTFVSQEKDYERRGIPFHRGYLLYGPPGTGKTSACKAIAHASGRDLYSVSLGSVDSDGGLSELFDGVPPNSILLLEDIDAFGAARERDEDDQGARTGSKAGLSTSGLLNALDGVDTPHGLVVLMTTNHKDFLDEAIVRPGRIDLNVFFGHPDDATVMRHFEFFYSRPASRPLYAGGRSGADVTDVFIRHMFDPEGAERVLSVPVLECAA